MVKRFFGNHTYKMSSNLASRLKELRKAKKISQARLAEELGFSTSFFGELEMGRTSVSTDTLVLLADYFGVSTDYLLGRTNSPLK